MRHRCMLVACLLFMAGWANADIGARLLLVEKEGRMALFLPEEHFGSPAQDDSYFRQVIRPAFAASSAMLAELSSVSLFDRAYFKAACPDEDPAEATLDTALNAALSRYPSQAPALLRDIAAADAPMTMGRFIRTQTLLMRLVGHGLWGDAHPAGKPVTVFTARSAQSSVLMALAPRRAISVDNLDIWLADYCGLTSPQRLSLIVTLVRKSAEQLAAPADLRPAAVRRARLYRDTDAEYRQALAELRADLPGTHAGNTDRSGKLPADELLLEQYLLRERNRQWVAALPAILARERLPFYALGARHFADGPTGPGLITLLHNAGYSITLIPHRQALDAVLARLPPSPPPAAIAISTLGGSCQQDGNSYGCSWRSDTTSYVVLKPQADQPWEIWSVCYARDSHKGPVKHCVSSTRPATAL